VAFAPFILAAGSRTGIDDGPFRIGSVALAGGCRMTKMTRNSLGRIWRWPLILAGLIIFGLLSALIGQGGTW
jgi:hypothetical protein